SWVQRASRLSARPTFSSRSSALAIASAFGTPSTWIGASMMFSSTDMFGNRLNCWNTIPTRRRTRLRRFSGIATRLPPRISCVYGTPSTRMRPSFASSSVMSRRRIVVLPEPDGPIRVTRSPAATEKSSPSRTTLSPKRLPTPWNWMAGFVAVSGKAVLHSADEERGRVAHQEEQQAGEGDRLHVTEVASAVGLCGGVHLDHVDEGEERRLLEHRDRVVPQAGQRVADGLRQDHVAPRAPARQVERVGRLPLPLRHRVDPRAVDLRHVGRVVDAQHRTADGERRELREQQVREHELYEQRRRADELDEEGDRPGHGADAGPAHD